MRSFEELKARVESNGYTKHTGVEVLEAGDGRAVGRIVLDERHVNPIGSIHGGCIFTLMETIAGTAFTSTGKVCTTLSSNVDFLNGAIGSKVLTAVAEAVRIGNHIAVFDVRVTDDRERLIARASVTFYVLENVKL